MSRSTRIAWTLRRASRSAVRTSTRHEPSDRRGRPRRRRRFGFSPRAWSSLAWSSLAWSSLAAGIGRRSRRTRSSRTSIVRVPAPGGTPRSTSTPSQPTPPAGPCSSNRPLSRSGDDSAASTSSTGTKAITSVHAIQLMRSPRLWARSSWSPRRRPVLGRTPTLDYASVEPAGSSSLRQRVGGARTRGRRRSAVPAEATAGSSTKRSAQASESRLDPRHAGHLEGGDAAHGDLQAGSAGPEPRQERRPDLRDAHLHRHERGHLAAGGNRGTRERDAADAPAVQAQLELGTGRDEPERTRVVDPQTHLDLRGQAVDAHPAGRGVEAHGRRAQLAREPHLAARDGPRREALGHPERLDLQGELQPVRHALALDQPGHRVRDARRAVQRYRDLERQRRVAAGGNRDAGREAAGRDRAAAQEQLAVKASEREPHRVRIADLEVQANQRRAAPDAGRLQPNQASAAGSDGDGGGLHDGHPGNAGGQQGEQHDRNEPERTGHAPL